jgi:hypothetical protein
MMGEHHRHLFSLLETSTRSQIFETGWYGYYLLRYHSLLALRLPTGFFNGSDIHDGRFAHYIVRPIIKRVLL